MIQDLKLDSQRWRAEKDGERGHGSGGSSLSRESPVSRQPDASLVAYQDSRTHASRQHYGPSEGYVAPPNRSSHSGQPYGAAGESPQYTTTPTPVYPSHPYGHAPPSHPGHTAPRTDPYANYGQSAAVAQDYRYASATPSYPYGQTAAPDPYGRSAPTTHYSPQQRYFGYFDEQFLVYR